jgi:hypothetical protein
MTRYRGRSDISSLLNHSHPRCRPAGVEHMARVLQSRCCVLRSRSQNFLKLCYPNKVEIVTTLQTRCSTPLLGSAPAPSYPIEAPFRVRISVLGRSRYALDLTIVYGTLSTFRSSGRWPTYRGAQVTPPLFVYWEQCDFSDPQTGTPTIDYRSCFRRNLISPPPIVSHNSLCRSCLVAVSRAVMRRLSPQITNTRS